ncbi:MAG: hypothetical protein K6T65_14270 [Peptococcaceae bacterium]|nr:hypothetical protein [Peptococcaceae bacterium]
MALKDCAGEINTEALSWILVFLTAILVVLSVPIAKLNHGMAKKGNHRINCKIIAYKELPIGGVARI